MIQLLLEVDPQQKAMGSGGGGVRAGKRLETAPWSRTGSIPTVTHRRQTRISPTCVRHWTGLRIRIRPPQRAQWRRHEGPQSQRPTLRQATQTRPTPRHPHLVSLFKGAGNRCGENRAAQGYPEQLCNELPRAPLPETQIVRT